MSVKHSPVGPAPDFIDPATLPPAQQRRRQQIVDAALKLVSAQNGNVEIRDIADEAGLALGTVYRYFGSKERLFAEVYLNWCRRYWVEFAVPDPEARSNADRLRDVTHRIIAAYEREPQFWRIC